MSKARHTSVERRSFGPYEVLETLGDGGTGVVLSCRHRATGERVAVKTPKGTEARLCALIRREIAVLGRLNRAGVEGVVRILEHGTERDVPWYAMELLTGPSLRALQVELWQSRSTPHDGDSGALTCTISLDTHALADRPGSPAHDGARPASPTVLEQQEPPRLPAGAGELERVLGLALGIATVLCNLHTKGIVHGDLTPANVILRREDDPVLIDFGAALAAGGSFSGRELPFAEDKVRGTPAYLAPEVIQGEPIDARSDLYALGCVLYELLTGRRPFSAARPADLLQQHLRATPTAPSRWVDGIPADLERVILRLLEKNPTRRVGHAEDVTRALRQALGHPESGPTTPSPPIFRPRLQGRDTELDRLGTAVDRAVNGHGGLLLLGGPSGIGKTRLMNEAGVCAARAGARVCWCRATKASLVDAEGAVVHGGAFESFAALVELAGDIRRNTVESQGLSSALATLRPYAAGAAGADALPAAPPAARRLALDALFELLTFLSEPNGLVLLVDDLQWIDELSLSFLSEYSRRFAETRVLIVANYRSDEAPGALKELAAGSSAVELEPLSAPELRALLKDLLGTEALPEGAFEFLQARSGGSPFLMAEYTRAAISSRLLLRHQDGSWSFAGSEAAADLLALPDSLERLLELRLRGLSERARAALGLLAVLGARFDAEMAGAMLDDGADAAELVEELVARGLVAAGSGGRFHFVHDRLREAEERALPAPLRAEFHRRAARYLEALGDRDAPDRAARLGYHWSCAGESERAIGYLASAADAAHALHALERAADLYRLCLRHSEHSTAQRERLPHLNESLADVLIAQARHLEARRRLKLALDGLGPNERLGRARLYRKLGASHWTVHEYEAAAEALSKAEAALGAVGEDAGAALWSELIQIRLGRFEQLYFSGKTGPVLDALVRELAPLIERHGTDHHKCVYYFIAASHLVLRQRYAFDAEAVELAEKGLLAAESLPLARQALARFMIGFTLVLGESAHCEQALPHFERATRDAERVGDATLLSRIRAYHTVALLRLGRIEATARLAQLALAAAEAAYLSPYVGAAEVALGWVAYRRGDSEAERRLESGRARWRDHPHKLAFTNLAVFPLLSLAHARDDFAKAKDLLSELPTGLPALSEALESAVRSALHALDAQPERRASEAISRVLELARRAALL